MSVWLALPSIRPITAVEPVLLEWHKRGYKIALLRQGERISDAIAAIQIPQAWQYPGWTTTVNMLARLILQCDSQAQWIVAGGDDLMPDSHQAAEEIGQSCEIHFGSLRSAFEPPIGKAHAYNGVTMGVMQPTGDRYVTPGSTLPYPDVEHSACSPWIGREFCERAYGGRGPLWPGYRHYWGDNELQEVAKKLGCFWQVPHLTQLHQHWSRNPDAACPEHLRAAHEGGAEVDRLLFEARRAAGFPGHELKGER